ncbi:unnamed protein product [Darwinula stevensoni]|uniref:Uncharacterized protein n=1 Tax=Darwinula stevensoni TaxID=69355 RepID=A0A7R9FSB4_9CRUS|nr:unnamed protein product [Darwinula stevensoni]CAG0903188.1 unnamed protein product [Darwinula stevensoni]
MITFADSKSPPVLEAVKEANIPFVESFCFNNSALFTSNEVKDSRDLRFDTMFWKLGAKSFSNFFDRFRESKPVSLQLSNQVLKERHALEATIQAIQTRIQYDEIALRPNPLSIIDYVDLLITSENFQMKPGFMNRVRILNEIRESLGKEGGGDERIYHQGTREKGTNSTHFSMCKRLGMSQNHQTEDEIPNRNPNAIYINRAQGLEEEAVKVSIYGIGDFLIGLFNVILDVTSGDLHRWTLEKVLQPDNDILILENNLDYGNMLLKIIFIPPNKWGNNLWRASSS